MVNEPESRFLRNRNRLTSSYYALEIKVDMEREEGNSYTQTVRQWEGEGLIRSVTKHIQLTKCCLH